MRGREKEPGKPLAMIFFEVPVYTDMTRRANIVFRYLLLCWAGRNAQILNGCESECVSLCESEYVCMNLNFPACLKVFRYFFLINHIKICLYESTQMFQYWSD